MSVYGEEQREAQGRILQRKLLKTIMAVLSQVFLPMPSFPLVFPMKSQESSKGRALASTSALGGIPSVVEVGGREAMPPGHSPWWGKYLRVEGQLWVL